MSASSYPIPATPRIISPSPTPSDSSNHDSYFATSKISSPETILEDATSDPELQRARARSRSPQFEKLSRKPSGVGAVTARSGMPSAAASKPTRRKPESRASGKQDEDTNGHLSPQSAGLGRSYWRQLSRSPSPLGLIPIHAEWRQFVRSSCTRHKHMPDELSTDPQT